MLVSILVMTKAVTDSWHDHDVQEGLQNFLLVIEMFFFAIAHYFVFSHRPYIDPAAAEVPCIATCFRMLDVRDVAGDVKEHFVDPIPRPKFRSGGGAGTRVEVEGGDTGSSEEAPLLRKGVLSTSRGRDEGSGEGSGEVPAEPPDRKETDGGKGPGVADLSFDVLSYGELDSRRGKYGMRAGMIADACKEVAIREEEGDDFII